MQERVPQRQTVTVGFTLNGRPVTAVAAPVRIACRHAAPRARPHRNQDRLRGGRLRRLHRSPRRPAGVRLPGADGAGRGRVDRDRRRRWPARADRALAPGVPGARRRAVRHLHSRHADGRSRPALPRADAVALRGRRRHRRRAVPLHRLPQDRRCGHGRGRRAARGGFGRGGRGLRRRGAAASGRRLGQGGGHGPVRRRRSSRRCALDARRPFPACARAIHAGRPGRGEGAHARARGHPDVGRRAGRELLRRLPQHEGPAGACARPRALPRRGGAGVGRNPAGGREHLGRRPPNHLDAANTRLIDRRGAGASDAGDPRRLSRQRAHARQPAVGRRPGRTCRRNRDR